MSCSLFVQNTDVMGQATLMDVTHNFSENELFTSQRRTWNYESNNVNNLFSQNYDISIRAQGDDMCIKRILTTDKTKTNASFIIIYNYILHTNTE